MTTATTAKKAPAKKTTRKKPPVKAKPIDFAVDPTALVAAIDLVSTAIRSSLTAIPAMAGVLMTVRGDELTLVGSDLDLSISTTIPVTSTGGDGAVLVAPKMVTKPLRCVDTDGHQARLTVGPEGEGLLVTAGNFTSRLTPFDAAEFPRLSWPDKQVASISADQFGDFKFVAGCTSPDQARPILTGVLVAPFGDGVSLVGTDSYRLGIADVAVDGIEGPLLIPAYLITAAIAEARRNGYDQITLHTSDNGRDVAFHVGPTVFAGVLIEGDFPNYKGLLPTQLNGEIVADRAAVLRAVRAADSVMVDGTPVRFQVTAGELAVTGVIHDMGQVTNVIDGARVDEDIAVGFNPAWLLYGLGFAGESDDLTIRYVDHLKPALFDVGPNRTYLLMPVRMS